MRGQTKILLLIIFFIIYTTHQAYAINSATGAYTHTFTGLSNGAWGNLSSGTNATSGTITFYNFEGGTVPATGGTITYVGDYTIHTFTTNGTFHPGSNLTVETLVIAGGGGGSAAGGGAGGLLYNSSIHTTVQDYTVVVGAGGAGTDTSTTGNNGQPSSFATLSATGGGGAGRQTGSISTNAYGYVGNNGGSGGGSGGTYRTYSGDICNGRPPATGIVGQGNDGGCGHFFPNFAPYDSSGGGGAGAAGSPVGNALGGAGGIGLMYNISGSNVYYAGGGAGGIRYGNYPAALGGNGGGGNAGAPGVNGTANTGGGGGGANETTNGGNGGSGIVIIRYLTPTGDSKNVYTTPQNHPNSENKTSDLSSITVNLSINSGTPIQNIQFFENSAGTFDATLNLQTEQIPAIEEEFTSNGYYYQNIGFTSVLDIVDVLINRTITNSTFQDSTNKGSLSVSSTDSNITSSGWSQWSITHNSSYIPAGIQMWYNSTIPYNNPPTSLVNNITCVRGEQCLIQFNASDAENNALQLSTIVNGTTKSGNSPHDWSELSMGTYEGTLWANETSNTVSPLLTTSSSFWITMDVRKQYGTPEGYTVYIPSGQITVLTPINTTFNETEAGSIGYINSTFNLNNTGNVIANVSARFTTNASAIYGMVNSTLVIPADSFSLQSAVQLRYAALNNNGLDAAMIDTVPIESHEDWNIRVVLPSGQTSADYTGMIEITFSDAV